jgi:peptidoglycan/LPS O-acetylase OafA/YrhL
MSERERRFEYLDWMRGVAAVLVLTYHARLLFSDWGAGGGSGGWAARLFYFITGFGHLAVVVFFVLSGCVIAHVVLPRLERADWSWSDYLLARVARFWTVLLPGLVLTLVWDWWGWKWFPGSLTHTATRYANLLTPADVEHLSVIHFLGNLFSLQTILVPCYGSNGALWSLACEFWYYCFFPRWPCCSCPRS